MLDQQQATPQDVRFLATRDGRDYRGEVVDGRSYATLAKTHLTYSNEQIALIAARRMWEGRAHRIAKAISGEVAA